MKVVCINTLAVFVVFYVVVYSYCILCSIALSIDVIYTDIRKIVFSSLIFDYTIESIGSVLTLVHFVLSFTPLLHSHVLLFP